MNNKFEIRNLTEADIELIADARKSQEIENGNGATEEYLTSYKKILKKLFDERKLIAVGAFDDTELASIACFNLISFGSEKKIPYLCAVWTNPKYRGLGLSTKVNNKLTDIVCYMKEQLQPRALLTLEGTEAAHNMYKKLGYEDVQGEMTFLGDLQSVEDIQYEECEKNDINKCVEYSYQGKPLIRVTYSDEQFLSHPTNLDGKMSRIVAINDTQGNASLQLINIFLQQFLSEHRFCKFNVKEIAQKERRLYDIFKVENGNINGLLNEFEKMKFFDKDGKITHIKISKGIMEKDLSRIFKYNNINEISNGENEERGVR